MTEADAKKLLIALLEMDASLGALMEMAKESGKRSKLSKIVADLLAHQYDAIQIIRVTHPRLKKLDD